MHLSFLFSYLKNHNINLKLAYIQKLAKKFSLKDLILKKQNSSSTRKVLVDLDFTQLAWQLQRIYILETLLWA